MGTAIRSVQAVCRDLGRCAHRPRLALSLLVAASFFYAVHATEIIRTEKIDIAKVWAGHPVNFAIRTAGDFQCVAYYDTTRRMVVAGRTLSSTSWSFKVLPTTTGWDSHNYIDMAIDDSGYIHLSGNMHNASSLIYYRSKEPLSVDEFTSPGMTGDEHGSITYPVFIKGPDSRLIFQYRNGGSGSGNTFWNSYDVATKQWIRLTNSGLFDGEGEVNAYQTSPVAGPDGFFHVIWMWRDTPVANTNHGLSHIKSPDLVSWHTMAGDALSMPVKMSTPKVVVDSVQSGHGLINMDFWISFDRSERPVVTYHRYDSDGVSQIFNTRYEEGLWKIYQTSDWSGFRWDLDREGSLTHDIAATPLSVDESGRLVQNYVYRNGEVRRWVLDEETLKPQSDGVYEPPEPMIPLYEVESPFPGMQVNFIRDGEYYIRWETMPVNQDMERAAGTYPSSSVLQLYRFTPASFAPAAERFVAATGGFRVEKTRQRIVVDRSRAGVKPFTVELLTVDGRSIASRSSGNSGCCVIATSRLPAGVYIIMASQNNAAAQSDPPFLAERFVVW